MQECCVKNNAIEVIWVGWSSLYELLERLLFCVSFSMCRPDETTGTMCNRCYGEL